MSDDPIARFRDTLAQAEAEGSSLPIAMALATADATGQPSVRMVLLRGVDTRGFVFYTHRGSRKGRELEARPRAALCFWWPILEVQVRIEGEVEPVSDAEADAYWRTRPRGSQLASAASRQSEVLPSRALYEQAVAALDARFADGEVPRPPEWPGYRVVPQRIEFWNEGAHRMHHRTLYTRRDDGWETTTLYP